MLLMDTFILALKNIWQQQDAHHPDHAGHHHRRDGRDRHRGSGQRHDPVGAGQLLGHGHQQYVGVHLGPRLLPQRQRGTICTRWCRTIPSICRISPRTSRSPAARPSRRAGIPTATPRSTGSMRTYTSMANYTIADGRGLQYMDIKENRYVCVIGDYLSREAFNGNAIGQDIKVGPYRFQIVGVLAAKGNDPELQEGGEDDRIYVPYTVAMKINSRARWIPTPSSWRTRITPTRPRQPLEQALYAIYEDEDAYYVYSMSELLAQMNQTISMVVMVLTLIAGISLLVGRHRHHEHHAGVCQRAHAGDSASARRWAPRGAHHPVPVRCGSGHHLGPGRRHRHPAGVRPVGGQPRRLYP